MLIHIYLIPYTERLYDIYNKDLSYPAIGEEFQKLYDLKFTDEVLVKFMFNGLLCKNITDKYKKTKIFMNWLVALMFGVEAGRNKCGLLTNLMLLDMVNAGTTYGDNKKITLKKLFVSEKGYKWDIGEGAKKYGGKYPMAVHGTPSNSIFKRYQVNSKIDVVRNNIHGLNLDEFGRKKDAVLLREVSLIIHWLEAYMGEDTISSKRLKKILWSRMLTTYWKSQGSWTLGNKSPRSSDHSKNMGPIEVINIGKNGNSYLIKGYRRREGMEVHLFNKCKLIPLTEKRKGLIDVTLEISDFNSLEKDRNEKKLCKYCISKADISNIVYLV